MKGCPSTYYKTLKYRTPVDIATNIHPGFLGLPDLGDVEPEGPQDTRRHYLVAIGVHMDTVGGQQVAGLATGLDPFMKHRVEVSQKKKERVLSH
jgi:hypothetical protein